MIDTASAADLALLMARYQQPFRALLFPKMPYVPKMPGFGHTNERVAYLGAVVSAGN